MFDLIRCAMYMRHVVRQRTPLRLGLLLQNRDSGFEVRRLDVGDQAPFEPRAQALLERGDFVRRPVAAQHDLFLRVVERVERVEELGLRAFLAGHELDVVDQQDVDAAIALAEVQDAVVAQRR